MYKQKRSIIIIIINIIISILYQTNCSYFKRGGLRVGDLALDAFSQQPNEEKEKVKIINFL